MSADGGVPAALLHNLSASERQQAVDFWRKLDTLAKTDRKAYDKTIQAHMKAAASESQVVQHSFTVASSVRSGTARGTRVYVNVCHSLAVRPMQGTDVSIVLARERRLADADAALLYDAVFHVDVALRAHTDDAFQRELVALICGCVAETFSRDVHPTAYTVDDTYRGPFLWRADGKEKTDAELRSVADMTPQDLLAQVKQRGDTEQDDDDDNETAVVDLLSAVRFGTASSVTTPRIEELPDDPEPASFGQYLSTHPLQGTGMIETPGTAEGADALVGMAPALRQAVSDEYEQAHEQSEMFSAAHRVLDASSGALVSMPGSAEGADHAPVATCTRVSDTQFVVACPLSEAEVGSIQAEAFARHVLLVLPTLAAAVYVQDGQVHVRKLASADEPVGSTAGYSRIDEDGVRISWTQRTGMLQVALTLI